MSLESQKNELAVIEQELENAKAHVYRLDGIKQYLTGKIKEAEDATEVESAESDINE